MVMMNPEDPRNIKTPHAGDLIGGEKPTNEYDNTPLYVAEGQYNLTGNIPGTPGEGYAPVTPEEQAAARQAVEALRNKQEKKGFSLKAKLGALGAGLAVLVGGTFVAKQAFSSSAAPTNTQPVASSPANPGNVIPTTIDQGTTSISITPTTASEVAPVVSGDKGPTTISPSSPEVTTKPNGSETGPVKGGLWDKLPADKQESFSKLSEKNWAEMDALTFQKEVYSTFQNSTEADKGSAFLEYAAYLYENNVGPALESAKSAYPRLAPDITDAENITSTSKGQTKILHQALVEATAYSVGAKDKDAGAVILGLAFDSAADTLFGEKLAEYNAFDFKTQHTFTVDTVMQDPTITYTEGADGTQGHGDEVYNDIIPDAGGHEMRRYTAYIIKNPMTGEEEYILSLFGTQVQ
ncbi:MAG: hypothetical protein ABIQ04_04475 [Candidatus Saccharimonadales bacterium]